MTTPSWPDLDDGIALRFLGESRALLCVVDGDGAITWANDSWHEQLGWSADHLAGRPITGLFHPEDLPLFRGVLLLVAQSHEPSTVGCRALTADGAETWVSLQVVPLGDGLSGVAGRDVDEVVRGRVRAVGQSRFLRSVLDAVDAAIAIVDESGKVVETYGRWNRAGVRGAGGVGAPVGTDYLALCRADPASGTAAATDVDPDVELADGAPTGQLPDVGRAVADVLSGVSNDAVVEYSHRRPGGRGWFEARVSALRLGDGRPGCVVAHFDITTRKVAERRFQEERALLRDIMAAVPFAVFWKDLGSRFLGANETMAELAGLDGPDDIRGLTDADLPWADLARDYQHNDRDVLATGRSELHVNGTLQVADGSTRHILASKVPMRDDDGQVEGLIGVFVDVTAQKEIEAQLANANKLESIGQLAAGVAHEINTPTQYVGDNLHFLDQSMGDLLPLLARARELAEAVAAGTVDPAAGSAYLDAHDAADVDYLSEDLPRAVTQSLSGIERVARIVGAMKEFSHPGVDTLVPVDLNRAVESSVTVSTNEWKYVAEMVTDLADDLPLVPGIAGELSQVFVNMIVNGAHAIAELQAQRAAERDHATDPGADGGEHDRGTIKVVTRVVDDHAEVRISDTGSGIPEHVRDRVFDHFFTTKEVGRGTGQGLSLAHGVVARHGGTIAFETESGAGTTFIVRLPLDRPFDGSSDQPGPG